MRNWNVLLAVGCAVFLCGGTGVLAAEKAPKLTCCQEAHAKKEECKHKCCIAAHKEGKSCQKCNPNKEDLKLPKDDKKGPKK